MERTPRAITIRKVIKEIERFGIEPFTPYVIYKDSEINFDSVKNVCVYLEVKGYLTYDELTKSYTKVED